MAFTTADNNFGVAKWIVDATAGQGTHTTIQAAINAASSGDTIFIRTGSYTENLTLSKNLTIYAFASQFRTVTSVSITGKATLSGSSIDVKFSGITFITSSDNSISLTGTGSSITCENCYFSAVNANSIAATGSIATNLYLENCSGSITGPFTLFTTTNAPIWIMDSFFTDVSGTPVSSTSSNAQINLINSSFSIPFATTSAGVIQAFYCLFGPTLTPYSNTTWLSTAGTATSFMFYCKLYSGTAVAISVGTGTTVEAYNCVVHSSNTNAISGAGSLNYSGLSFAGTSSLINTTTQTGGTLKGGRVQAPSAGFIGEQVRSFVNSVSTLALTNSVNLNVTSISLTAGVWDISGIVAYTGSPTGTQLQAGISTTSATLIQIGDATIQDPRMPTSNSDSFLCIPSWRLVITSTTTVYLVALGIFSSGTIRVYGRISATRVG